MFPSDYKSSLSCGLQNYCWKGDEAYDRELYSYIISPVLDSINIALLALGESVLVSSALTTKEKIKKHIKNKNTFFIFHL